VALATMVLAGAIATACAESTPQPNTAGGAAGSGTESPAGSVAEEEFSPQADELRDIHRHRQAGFIDFALMSIPTLGVTANEQVAVDKIHADIKAKMHPAHEATAALLRTVADGIAAGNIDMPKVDAAVAKVAEISTQMDDATNDAVNQLHAALSPPEREALVLKVQAHFMIWHKANAEEQVQPDQEKEGGHIHYLAKVLGLSPDQVTKIDAAFTQSITALYAAKGKFDMKAAEDHLEAFVKAFPADQFDAKTLTTSDKANSSVTTWGAMRMARFYESMTPVLTPDQRTKLAGLLRDHAAKLEAK
jgi:Spy/CpxP family protein refolding chaperone